MLNWEPLASLPSLDSGWKRNETGIILQIRNVYLSYISSQSFNLAHHFKVICSPSQFCWSLRCYLSEGLARSEVRQTVFRGGSEIRRLPLFAFPGPERPSAFRRRPLWWLVAVGAVGWWLVSGDLPCLIILCLEDVLAPGSAGGCVGRLCGCLSTARLWRALFLVQCRWFDAASAHYHPLFLSFSLSPPPSLPTVCGGSQCTVLHGFDAASAHYHPLSLFLSLPSSAIANCLRGVPMHCLTLSTLKEPLSSWFDIRYSIFV